MGSRAIYGVGSNFNHAEAAALAQDLSSSLLAISGVEEVVIAGSLRRGHGLVNDLDLVVLTDDDAHTAMRLGVWMANHGVARWDAYRATGSFAAYIYGAEVPIQVDIYKVSHPGIWGTQVMTWTGPKAHNIAMRTWAGSHGWKLSQNGLSRIDGSFYATRTEEEVFTSLGVPFIPPEHRDEYVTTASIFRLAHSVAGLKTQLEAVR
jgi:DNA polymerase (family 10)